MNFIVHLCFFIWGWALCRGVTIECCWFQWLKNFAGALHTGERMCGKTQTFLRRIFFINTSVFSVKDAAFHPCWRRFFCAQQSLQMRPQMSNTQNSTRVSVTWGSCRWSHWRPGRRALWQRVWRCAPGSLQILGPRASPAPPLQPLPACGDRIGDTFIYSNLVKIFILFESVLNNM